MKTDDHFVDFFVYCKQCKHYEKEETEDPCVDCLENPTNQDSRKPTQFESQK